MNNFVELFSGCGEVSRCFSATHNVFSIDIRKRKGICEPTLRKDIFKCERKDIPFEIIHVLWCSVPCTAFSYSAGNYYFSKGGIIKPTATPYVKILIKTLRYIQLLKPTLWFIENPRGHLRYQKVLIDFLTKNNGMIKELTLGSYGFPTTKPTNIFTNAVTWQPKQMLPFGKYYSKCKNDFSNLTIVKRQKIPFALAEDIRMYCESYRNETTPALKVTGT